LIEEGEVEVGCLMSHLIHCFFNGDRLWFDGFSCDE
jgi:hypothetical protein